MCLDTLSSVSAAVGSDVPEYHCSVARRTPPWLEHAETGTTRNLSSAGICSRICTQVETVIPPPDCYPRLLCGHMIFFQTLCARFGSVRYPRGARAHADSTGMSLALSQSASMLWDATRASRANEDPWMQSSDLLRRAESAWCITTVLCEGQHLGAVALSLPVSLQSGGTTQSCMHDPVGIDHPVEPPAGGNERILLQVVHGCCRLGILACHHARLMHHCWPSGLCPFGKVVCGFVCAHWRRWPHKLILARPSCGHRSFHQRIGCALACVCTTRATL
jgi:hypothetical protein